MSTKCTCYCHQGGELYHGDRPCCGRPYELFDDQKPAATTERSSAVARAVAVPADVIDALRDCADDAEQHPLYLGDDADSMRIDGVGGDAALVTVIAQRCRNALRLLGAPGATGGES